MTSVHPHHSAPMNWPPQCAASWPTDKTPAAHLLTRVQPSPNKPVHIGVLKSIDPAAAAQLIPSLLLSIRCRRRTAWRQTTTNGRPAIWAQAITSTPHFPTPYRRLSRTQPIWWIGLISTASRGCTTIVSFKSMQITRAIMEESRPRIIINFS